MKTAFLCRTNAPLVKCAFSLIKKGRGIKVRMVGRDIAKKLKELIGEVLDYRNNASIPDFINLLNDWILSMRAKYIDKEGFEGLLAECEDLYDCLLAITGQAKDALDMHVVLDSFFVDSDEIANNDDSVILYSGHRAKGLEWDRVVVLRPDLMPHPCAKLPADIEQEEHLKYVILTRAKKELIICHDEI